MDSDPIEQGVSRHVPLIEVVISLSAEGPHVKLLLCGSLQRDLLEHGSAQPTQDR